MGVFFYYLLIILLIVDVLIDNKAFVCLFVVVVVSIFWYQVDPAPRRSGPSRFDLQLEKMAVQGGRDSALDKKDNTEWLGHTFYVKVGILYSYIDWKRCRK